MSHAKFFLALSLSVLCSMQGDFSYAKDNPGSRSEVEATRKFISRQMPLSVRYSNADTLGCIPMPKPYSVPCVKGIFQDMFYWDTYFTNLGLLSLGDVEQARNNVDDILYLIGRFGYMPNASNRALLNRSQPPYASMMVDEVFKVTGDLQWLRHAVEILEKEYDFWMTERMSPSGLNCHGNSATEQELREFYYYMTTRIPSLSWDIPDEERIMRGSHFLSEAESGWDFSPRFDSRCEDFNPIDLNANLYIYEKNFVKFYDLLGIAGGGRWEKAASRRKKLMEKLCRNRTDGLYYDYDWKNRRQGTVFSSAVFNLLWAGILSENDAEAVRRALPRLEAEYGIVACEPAVRTTVYQWDSPNAWASFNNLAVQGLDAYGYKEDARRVAQKYADAISGIYMSTGNMWEKYNGVKGNIEVTNEYALPPFMGWTAGAFMYATDYLGCPPVNTVFEVTDLTTEMSHAPLCVESVHPRLSWKLKSDAQSVMQKSYRVTVASDPSLLAAGGDMWDSGIVQSDSSVYVPYRGKMLEPMTRYWWQVEIEDNRGHIAKSCPVMFQTGITGGENAWGAEWIGGELPGDRPMEAVPARYLRRQFVREGKKVKYATLYIVGLGLYDAFLNGKRIGDAVLQQMPTEYTKLIRYNAHDVTDMLKSGSNTVGVTLSNGRFAPEGMKTMKWFGFPKLFCRLEIVYDDGSRQSVVSDGTWKLTDNGPVRAASEYNGEVYDARLEMDGWACNGYDDSSWIPAPLTGCPGGRFEPQMNPSIKIMDVIMPRSLRETRPGVYVLDMGQNMVGWLQSKFRWGKPGQEVKIRFSETLNPDGSLYVANLRSAKCCDTYIFKGLGEETWEPSFTYRGFRYAEISGLDYVPSDNEFLGMVIHDEMDVTGTFTTSDRVINQVYRNAFWGIRGNYRGMPTDCPQRDERLPWLGDRTTGAYGESFLFGNHLLYAKWLDDIESVQKRSGGIPAIAPNYWDVFPDDVTWPAAYLTTADMLYRQYGDSWPIIKHYPSMKRWYEHISHDYMEDWIVTRDEFGDWCMPPESLEMIHSQDPSRITDGALLATSHFYFLAGLLADFAEIAGHEEDAERFRHDAAMIKDAFNRKFFDYGKGCYANNTVTSNLLPLRFGMVPEGYIDKVAGHIVERTEKEHISVGLVGIQHLMRGLTENGRADLALGLASRTDYPSWGYMAENGATTIWELWNGNTADPAMNSGNHVMLIGDLLIWEYSFLAGISNAEGSAGYRQIVLRPYIPEGLESVSASYESVYGTIKSAWTFNDGTFTWKFTIPANTVAEVYVPTSRTTYRKQTFGSGDYEISNKF